MADVAIVLGATGLVGSALVKQLQADERFGAVRVIVRRSTGSNHPKLTEHIVDFDAPETWQHFVKGDVLFSAFGTTLAKAGSKDAQYKIDYTYQYETAVAAANNGVESYVLISSAGASPKSSIFYSRMKGELEEAVRKLPFSSIYILQPGILDGDRKEKRTGEGMGIKVARLLGHIPGLKKYRPIHADVVAKAMINAYFTTAGGVRIATLEGVFDLAN